MVDELNIFLDLAIYLLMSYIDESTPIMSAIFTWPSYLWFPLTRDGETEFCDLWLVCLISTPLYYLFISKILLDKGSLPMFWYGLRLWRDGSYFDPADGRWPYYNFELLLCDRFDYIFGSYWLFLWDYWVGASCCYYLSLLLLLEIGGRLNGLELMYSLS